MQGWIRFQEDACPAAPLFYCPSREGLLLLPKVKMLYLISKASLSFKPQSLSTAVTPIAATGCSVCVVALKCVKETLIRHTYTSYLACSYFSQFVNLIAS